MQSRSGFSLRPVARRGFSQRILGCVEKSQYFSCRIDREANGPSWGLEQISNNGSAEHRQPFINPFRGAFPGRGLPPAAHGGKKNGSHATERRRNAPLAARTPNRNGLLYTPRPHECPSGTNANLAAVDAVAIPNPGRGVSPGRGSPSRWVQLNAPRQGLP